MLRKEAQKKEENMKNLKKANESSNEWKFQTHWNNLEWVVPRSRNVKKIPFVNIPTSFISR